MSKTLIHPNKLKETLKTYNSFCDSEGRLISTDKFMVLFIYKFGSFDDIFQFWIHEDKLHCQNICGFEIIFPLHKKL